MKVETTPAVEQPSLDIDAMARIVVDRASQELSENIPDLVNRHLQGGARKVIR